MNLYIAYYFYRLNKDGWFSNGSSCGNELASEQFMVRKYIVVLVIYWTKKYHIYGVIFDLMDLHDLDTIKEVREALDKIEKFIIICGKEGLEVSIKFVENSYNSPNYVNGIDLTRKLVVFGGK